MQSPRRQQWSTNITHKAKDQININPTENWLWTEMLRKGKQFLFHMWCPSCYSCYEPGDKWTGLWLKQTEHIGGHLCDTDIPEWLTMVCWRPLDFQSDDFNLTTRNLWFNSFYCYQQAHWEGKGVNCDGAPGPMSYN